jgi:hypothetical protein
MKETLALIQNPGILALRLIYQLRTISNWGVEHLSEFFMLVITWIYLRIFCMSTYLLAIFVSRNDIIKTANMTPALTRKVVAPSMLCKSPPANNPIILARLAKLFATPWTVP